MDRSTSLEMQKWKHGRSAALPSVAETFSQFQNPLHPVTTVEVNPDFQCVRQLILNLLTVYSKQNTNVISAMKESADVLRQILNSPQHPAVKNWLVLFNIVNAPTFLFHAIGRWGRGRGDLQGTSSSATYWWIIPVVREKDWIFGASFQLGNIPTFLCRGICTACVLCGRPYFCFLIFNFLM